MKLILTMDVAGLGARGDRIDVAAGYARNYLMPRRLAVPATPGNLRALEEEGKLGEIHDRKGRREAEKVREFLADHELFTTLKIGREGKAFGAVTSKDVGILLRMAGLEVDRRRIQLDTPIKRLGVFEIPLAVHPDVDTRIKLFVDQKGGTKEGAVTREAGHQAKLEAAEEAARAEAEARATREREAEEAARIAIAKAEARRKAREEAETKAREKESTAAAGASDTEKSQENDTGGEGGAESVEGDTEA
jgi:large subunit ribosomal protein L9